MRGRARGNPRPNVDFNVNAAEMLEGMNFGRRSEFTEEERLAHCAYYVDAYGERVRAPTLFAARAGSTMYLSRRERNRMQHALVGNTASRAELMHLTSGRLAAAGTACAWSDGSTSVYGRAMGAPRLLDFGSRLGRFRNKCLQNAVLGLCRSSPKDAVRSRLPQTCCNHRGSGLAGGLLEASNFQWVGKVLRCYGKRVRVLDVKCRADFWEGSCLGAWNMGSAHGTLLGTLVWSRLDRHVYVAADCHDMHMGLDAGGYCCNETPPALGILQRRSP